MEGSSNLSSKLQENGIFGIDYIDLDGSNPHSDANSICGKTKFRNKVPVLSE